MAGASAGRDFFAPNATSDSSGPCEEHIVSLCVITLGETGEYKAENIRVLDLLSERGAGPGLELVNDPSAAG